MKKFYSKAGTHGLGVFALFLTLCLASLLALSSCGDNNDTSMEPEPVKMKGFYISVDYSGGMAATDCTSGDVYIHDKTASNSIEPNIRVTEGGEQFTPETSFAWVGVKTGENERHNETIAAYYVSITDDEADRPGAYFLAARTDEDVSTEKIYTGYWTGYAYRGEHPVVMCPYVLVPANTEGLMDITDAGCGGDSDTSVHEKLSKYLMDDNGLRDCHKLVDEQGVLSPMSFEQQ